MPIQSNNASNSSLILTNPLNGTNFFRPLTTAVNSPVNAVANTAYFTFMGRTILDFIPLKLYISQPTAGTGTASAALGLFSTTTPPNGSNLVMSPIITTSAVTYDGTNLRLGNTTSFSNVVTAGTYLWAGFISNYLTTQGVITEISSALGNLDGFQVLAGSTVATFIGGGSISANAISPGINSVIYPVITF